MQLENLGKLERRLHIAVPVAEIEKEVDTRLKRLSRTVKMAGFRPGKVPMKIVAQQYGFQVHNEVVNEKIGSAFSKAVEENRLRVAGSPNITASNEAAEATVAFEATFEIYPEVKIVGLDTAEVARAITTVDDTAVDKTIGILRQQRTHFHSKNAHAGHEHAGQEHEGHDHGPDDGAAHVAPEGTSSVVERGDRVTVDFIGTLDGTPFEGGSGSDFAFVIGEGRMLPEFEAAALGLAVGATNTFDLRFPDDYHGKDVAGKTARFTLTVKDIEWAHVPPVDAEFASSLGVGDGDLDKMRADIRSNLEREVRKRLSARTKDSVMNALLAASEADMPKALIDAENERLMQNAAEEMRRRGIDRSAMPITPELFQPQAERRVKLGLILAELVKTENLAPTQEQLKAHVEDLAQSYERPAEVVRWYFADRTRLAEIEALVLEENVVTFVLGKSKVNDVDVPFDELMANG